MTSGRVQVTFDCAEPATLAAFWAEVLGYPPPDIEGTHAVLRALGQGEDELGNWYVTDEAATFFVLQDPEGNEFCVG